MRELSLMLFLVRVVNFRDGSATFSIAKKLVAHLTGVAFNGKRAFVSILKNRSTEFLIVLFADEVDYQKMGSFF